MKWSEDYAILALNIDRNMPGLVDSYFGPDRLRKIRLEKGELRGLCNRLVDSVPTGARQEYLKSQLDAMSAVIRIIDGEDIDYKKKVKMIFGIRPDYKKVPEISDEDILLVNKMKDEYRISKLLSVSEKVLEYCKKKSGEILGFLPIPESKVEFRLVRNKPWSAYNWYMGNLRSVIDINFDVPHTYHMWIETMCHETFPGHHLEHAIKEKELYGKKKFIDASVLLTLAPESVISEGIACNAWRMIFKDFRGLLKFSNEEFGTGYDIENHSKLMRRTDGLSVISTNAALMYHQDGENRNDVINYIIGGFNISEKEAEQRFRFIEHNIWSLYLFNYGYGEKLTKRALGKKKLLTALYKRQLTPTIFKKL